MPAPLLDIAGVAARYCVTERWVRRQVELRQIPFIKVGRLVRFDPDDLDTYLSERRVPAEAS